MLDVLVKDFPAANGTPAFSLFLRGELEGGRGVIVDDSGLFSRKTYRVEQILLKSGGTVFIRAILPNPVDLPAALIHKTKDELADPADEIQRLIDAGKADLVTRFKALRGESFRRLLTIEVEWNAKTEGGAVRGAFLDARVDAAGEVALRGEAKLALALMLSTDDIVSGIALAEFRAIVSVDLGGFERTYGIACRIGLAGEAKLAIELDDLNFSFPEISLPTFDLSTALRVNLPGGAIAGKLAGAFSRLIEGFSVTYTWTPADPQLVVMRDGQRFLFAAMKPGLTDAQYNLTNGAQAADLATLKAVINRDALTITAESVQLAVHRNGTIANATVTVAGSFDLGSGSRAMGPLQIDWTDVTVTPMVGAEGGKAFARASVKFKRLMLTVVDDPSAVIAFSGEIELSLSGARVVELQLVEPYPIELLKRGAATFLRGAQKIVQVLSRIDPPNGDTSKLQKLLEVLGKIAAAIGKAAVFIANEIADIVRVAAELVAAALVKIAEALGELLAAIGELIPKLQAPSLDVEVRIALEPFELRQVLITVRGEKADNSPKELNALGLKFAIERNWRPALLVDFVHEPGAYLLAIHAGVANGTFATISTDLWMKRPDNTTAPVRDANAAGERDPKPLIKLTLGRANAQERLFLLLAGVSRGEPVFLRFAGDTAKAVKDVAVPGGSISVLDRPFAFQPLTKEMLAVDLEFEKDRILALLGMGESGKDQTASGDTFLDKLQKSLGQVVTVAKIEKPHMADDGRKVIVAGLVLNVKAAGISTQVTLNFELDLATFEVTLTGAGDAFPLKSKRIEERALGLTWIVEQKDEEKRKKNEEVPMFQLAFSGAESGFQLDKKNAQMELHFDGLSSDGQGVVFKVEEFRVGRGGVDLVAVVDDRAVVLNGLDVPFRFHSGRLEIRGSKLVGAVVVGRGQLPPDLIGEANCTVALAFAMQDGEIVVQSGKVELEKKGEPIVCHATRFTITITDLDLGFAKDGGYHFYFLVTGSLRFTPKSGEFEDGLLKHLADVEISLERTPLTGDARVLMRHISFQKALNPKKTFPLFNIFTFELRGFGFHPASPNFEGHPPAVSISGQIRFADLGDVMQPKIDFHELWIAPPKDGESLPRIKAAGLGIELQLAGAVKMRGAVLAVDPDTKTVEGARFAPPGYDTYGFLGEGALDIPGWCSIEASMGFLEVERQDHPGERKKAFFLYLQANKLAVEIPTPVWTFYLREAGFGFGYRYTLAGIKDAENAKSTAALVRVLDDVSKRQGDLARFSAWKPDVEKDNFTLALRGAFQTYPAEKTYEEAREKAAVNPFFFDIVAALRSDFTFLMSARGWLGVNYATFLANKDNFRERPTYRGYLYISVPRSELLLRGIADSKGFIGEDWPEIRQGSPLRRAVESVDWTTTLYIRPGLLHYEVGWPDQLSVRLVDDKNMRVVVRGGMIFRAAEDGLLFGYNIGADAFLRFEGRAGDSIGVAIVAELNARFVARVIAFLASNFKGSLVYGLVSLDARLTFSVQAWMDVDLGFTSFTINIGFSFSVQFTAAVELAIADGGVGGRVDARIAVQVFGCSLGVGIGFTFNAGQLDSARARVQRFLALSITSEEPDSPPAIAAKSGDTAIEKHAENASAVHRAPEKPRTETPVSGLKPSIFKAPFGRDINETDFFLVLRHATVDPNGQPVNSDFAYGLFVPRESAVANRGGFYAAPEHRDEAATVHTIETDAVLADVQIWTPGDTSQGTVGGFRPYAGGNRAVTARWNAPIAVPDGKKDTFTLALFFDECFLADTRWELVNNKQVRKAENWKEPKKPRAYKLANPLEGSREERNQLRDQHQKAHAADAIESPYDERAYQARSTLLTMFLDQFVTLANTGKRAEVKFDGVDEAHVTDLGLVVFGPVNELEKLSGARIRKADASSAAAGEVSILNPRKSWFDVQDPVLANARTEVASDGIKLDWRLSVALAGDIDPDHFIEYYEVLRTIEGSELTPYVVRAKPVPLAGESKGNEVMLDPPDWQFVDSLGDETGVSPAMRRALLPSIGETEGLEAAKAWIEVFRGETEVTVTYSVTPVDSAGVRGLPRSFVVDVRRPEAPIHPAVGELRMVQKLDASAKKDGRQNLEARPEDLEIFLALNDQGWGENAPDDVEIGEDTYLVERVYRVVVDPEDLEPAGHYGSDGATARVCGPGAWAPTKTADEKAFDVPRSRTVAFTDALSQIEEIEPEVKTLNLPSWALLSDQVWPQSSGAVFTREINTLFRDLLWTGRTKDVRVATRFSLETVLRFINKRTKEAIDYVSKRVALPVEHRIEESVPVKDGRQTIATLRPDAFEWAVPLKLPPLAPGQVRAESGFARFRVPQPAARLGDLESKPAEALFIERDAERRVLTTVSFAAVPDWAHRGSNANPKMLHGASLAGFDLYELDLDELAPLDVDPKNLAENAKAWKRARRVARIQQLSRDDGRLVPSGNEDWQGWQAHYPSETQRLLRARVETPTRDSKPIRAAWYSDRESTAHFAERRPRLRLLPLPPETAIAALMRTGRPHRVTASISGTEASLPKIRTHRVEIDGLRLDDPFELVDGAFVKRDKTAFDAKDLRNLLLSLGWDAFLDKSADAWRHDPRALDGLTLVLVAHGAFKHLLENGTESAGVLQPTGSIEIPLGLRSPVHPFLEEVLAELALAKVGNGVYRRYVVMPQPFTPMAAKDFEGFMAGTAPETDPYGWKALQALGCATTVRLFDRDQETFVTPRELQRIVNGVFCTALRRWRDAYPNDFAAIVGQPFAEVFLRPGADRLAGPFDAVIKNAVELEKAPPLRADDEALGFLQLSLRPRPVAVWKYRKQLLKRGARIENRVDARLRGVSIRVTRRADDIDVARARGGAIAELIANATTTLIAMPLAGDARELTLFFRTAGPTGTEDRPLMEVVVEWERIADGTIFTKPIAFGVAGCPFELDGDWNDVAEPAEDLDPFARFEPVTPEKWTAALRTHLAANPGIRALREATAATLVEGFVFPAEEGYGTIISSYLTWLRRFLEQGAPRMKSDDPQATKPFLALAAPVKASPWKLAADAEGYVTLTFLHSDRWAHARVYAVKPIGRYHETLAGIGVAAEQEAETFDSALPQAIGYAVAVSPRTERLEPPVIVKSSLAPIVKDSNDPEHFVTELIVARHGEESLAMSNRALLARLGVPTSLLAFSRAYRTPRWPDRLQSAIDGNQPVVEMLPIRKAEVPVRPDDVTFDASDVAIELINAAPLAEGKLNMQLDGAAVRLLADEYPGLWKGADIWRIAPIPPHYRLVALASERAGIVVSDVVSVVQEEQPRRELARHDFTHGSIALRFVRDAGDRRDRVRLVLHHPLISHADLTPDAAKGWLGHAKAADVCWWPDPDVVYVLLRRRSDDREKTFVTEEEDAEIRLVATVEGEPGEPSKRRPVVVRARGPRYGAEIQTGQIVSEQIVSVTTDEQADRRSFALDSSLQLRLEKDETTTIRLQEEEYRDAEQIRRFNENAVPFAAILTPHTLTIDAPLNGETANQYRARLAILRDGLRALLTEMRARESDRRMAWLNARFLNELQERIDKFALFLETQAPAQPTAEAIKDLARLPFVIRTTWRRESALPVVVDGVMIEPLDLNAASEVFLAVWDFATVDEITALQNACDSMIAQDRGRLYVLLLRRLLAGANSLWLRAIDGRARIAFDGDGKPIGTPGVVMNKVVLPPWLEMLLEGGVL